MYKDYLQEAANCLSEYRQLIHENPELIEDTDTYVLIEIETQVEYLQDKLNKK